MVGENGQQKGQNNMRINKYIAACGVCSRRKAEELIKDNKVFVNGDVVTNLAYLVMDGDAIEVNGIRVKPQKHVYILLNKPLDVVTTAKDERGRKTVLDVIGKKIKERIYPVGRLDRATTGLLLLTSDGDFAQQLAHPKHQVPKVYVAKVNKPFVDMTKLRKGVRLRDDGVVKVDSVSYSRKDNKRYVRVTLHSGKYRVVRRLFSTLGYVVQSLDRVKYAHLTKKGLPLGAWRRLSLSEIADMKGE